MQGLVATAEMKVSIAAEEIGNCISLSKRLKINAKVQISLQGCFAWISVPASCLESEGRKAL